MENQTRPCEVPGDRALIKNFSVQVKTNRARMCLRWAAVWAIWWILAPHCPLWAQVSVTTYHNDNGRSGQNTQETVLTPTNVNGSQFGKIFSVGVDGAVYAQPLYLANVNIGAGTHNVLYVATSHDSLYAIDADNGSVYWQLRFLNPAAGINSVSSADIACSDSGGEVGITGTPVIDPNTNTIYFVTKTNENGLFHQRLHAIDVVSQAEKFGAPVEISASVSGTGAGGTVVNFNPLTNNQRAALLLFNGHVVIAWASHCDNLPFTGWLMSYAASNVQAQEAVYSTTPDGTDGGIWMGGAGPAADSNGNIFFATGNGSWDGVRNFSDSILKLGLPNGGTFPLTDWFTAFNQSTLAGGDDDVGSGGVLLLPDLPVGSAHQHLLVQSGKEGRIYLIDRDNMGHYCTSCSTTDTQIVQAFGPSTLAGVWGMPAYWNGNIYWGSVAEGSPSGYPLKAYSFNAAGSGLLSNNSTSSSAHAYGYSGPTPSVSANGNTRGIVWALDNSAWAANCCQVLYAYDATNLGTELYNTTLNSARDSLGRAVKFTVPTIANGRVYVGGQGLVTALSVLSGITATPTFSPTPGTYATAQSVALSDATSGAAIYYTTDGSTPTTSSTIYTGSINVGSGRVTIKAIAAGSGLSPSPVASGTYTISQAVAAPSFNPTPGTYTAPQSVALSDTTSGATIYYTTDGSTPTTSSTVYSGPIKVSSGTVTIKAIAAASGFATSPVASGIFTISTSSFAPIRINSGGAAYTDSAGNLWSADAGFSGGNVASTTQSIRNTNDSTLYQSLRYGVFTYTSPVPNGTYNVTLKFAEDFYNLTNLRVFNVAINGTPVLSNFDIVAAAGAMTAIDKTFSTTVTGGQIAIQFTKGSADLPQVNAIQITQAGATTASPSFNPAPGSYTTTQSVALSDATSGATIYYTTDGSTPTTSSTVYTNPISVTSGTVTIKAIAAASGLSTSPVASGTYTISQTVAAPSFSPAPGTYTAPQSVAIFDATSGATIYYTIDGSTPTTSSTVYSGPINISSGTVTIKAIAAASGLSNSRIASGVFTISSSSYAPIRINSGGSAYTDSAGNLWNADAGFSGGSVASITQPVSNTSDSTLYQSLRYGVFTYTSPVPNGTYNVTLKFAEDFYNSTNLRVFNVAINGTTVLSNFDIVAAAGAMTAIDKTFSTTVTGGQIAIQFIKGTADLPQVNAIQITQGAPTTANPTFSPTPGTYTAAQSVTLSDATSGATIYYTTDGSTPTTSSAVYTNPVNVSSGTVTIKAIAAASGLATSPVASGTYTISASSFAPVRVNSGGPAYTDSAGNLWSTDAGFSGGNVASVTQLVSNTNDSTLYQDLRYGVLTYTTNVPNGTYNVTLKFSENFYNSTNQRVFNVTINGTTVLSNFDIVAAAGAMTAIDKTFSTTVTGGQIVIQLTKGTADLPQINAIQISQ